MLEFEATNSAERIRGTLRPGGAERVGEESTEAVKQSGQGGGTSAGGATDVQESV